jgi:hypothetical protein
MQPRAHYPLHPHPHPVARARRSLQEFVKHIARQTNMRILTPISALEGCTFLAANLYARSVFGEDALVNISVEHRPDGTIKGHIRIRAKTQGVALSLGDRITAKQKATASSGLPIVGAPAAGGAGAPAAAE